MPRSMIGLAADHGAGSAPAALTLPDPAIIARHPQAMKVFDRLRGAAVPIADDVAELGKWLRFTGNADKSLILIRSAAPFAGLATAPVVVEYVRSLMATDDVAAARAAAEGLVKAEADDPAVYVVNAELLAAAMLLPRALEHLEKALRFPIGLDERRHLVYRAASLRTYMAARLPMSGFGQPARAAAAPDAVVVMMVRDEDDIIRQNVRHHYALGFRNFVIVLNRCRDDTATLLTNFRDRHGDVTMLLIDDPTDAYYQAAKTQAAVVLAQSWFRGLHHPVRWCFVLDADEFLHLDDDVGGVGSLIAAAEREGREAIVLQLCPGTNAEAKDWEASGSLYRHFDVVAGRPSPVVTKNAFLLREPLNMSVMTGNHHLSRDGGIELDHLLIGEERGARLVHLQARGLAQQRAKTIIGGEAMKAADKIGPGICVHWVERYRDYLERGDAACRHQLRAFHKMVVEQADKPKPFAF